MKGKNKKEPKSTANKKFSIKDKFSSLNKKFNEFNKKTLDFMDNTSTIVDDKKANINAQIVDRKEKINDYINTTTKKTKKFFIRNKVPAIASAATAGVLVFSLSIYFSQTLYFYQMSPVESKEGNNIDTLYSHDSYIAKTHSRKVAGTYSGTVQGYDDNGNDKNVTFLSPDQYPSQDYDYSKLYTTGYNDAYKKMYEDNRAIMSSKFIQEQISKGTLKKHPAADYQYGYANRLPDSAPAVDKFLNIDLTQPGFITTGLYLAPGEILTIKFSGLTDAEIKNLGITLSLGESDNSSPGYGNTGQYTRSSKRMPTMNSKISITSNNFKWGTPFGGIVNIVTGKQPGVNDKKNVAIEIDGAVEAISYVHGSTTKAEWKRLLKEAKAPVFDISADHMKFIGPVSALAKGYKSITNLPYPYKSMDLFDKMALDALYSVNWNSIWKEPYRITFSNFVPAGEAVSFVGASFIVAPWYWANGLLNYDDLVANGSWGIMHENNHQNQRSQGWGYTSNGIGGSGIEVTNNVLTVASYIKFTNVFSNRDGKQGASDHISKVNGYNAQSVVNTKSPDTNTNQRERAGIDQDYSVIMEEFGPEAFQNAIRSYYNSSVKNYENQSIKIPTGVNTKNAAFAFRVSEVTGYNWANYAASTGLILKATQDKINEYYQSKNVKEYLPVFSFYSSETNYDNRGFVYTQTPFTIPSKYFNNGYTFNLKNLTNTGNNYQLIDPEIVSYPSKGTLTTSDNKSWIYKPNLSYNNGDDEFIYKVIVSKKTSTLADDNSSATYQPIDVQFKVKIKLQGRTNPFVVPGNSKYQQFFREQKISDFAQIKKEDFESSEASKNITFAGSNDQANFIKVYNRSGMWHPLTKSTTISGENVGAVTFQVHFNKNISINYLQLNTPTSYFELPDGIVIKNLTKESNGTYKIGEEVYNGGFTKSTNSTFVFNNAVNSDGLEISLTTYSIKTVSNSINSSNSNDGYNPETTEKVARADFVRISGIDVGTVTQPNQILTPDSNWLYYVGDWRKGQKDGKVNGSSLFTIFPSTKLQFAFNGTSFAIVGTKDVGYGTFDVYVDGKFQKTVKTSASSRNANEPLYIGTGLEDKDHFVTLITKNSAPVEIQYISLNGTAKPISVNDWYYFLIIALPIIAFLVAVLITLTVIYYKKFPNKK